MAAVLRSPGLVTDGADLPDAVLHLKTSGEKAGNIVRLIGVILMQGNIVNMGIAVRQNGFLPCAEGRHGPIGASAGYQLDGGIEPLHHFCGLAGDPAVFLRGFRTDLPGTVHLVAQAPELDAVGGGASVFPPQIGIIGAVCAVDVFQEIQGVLRCAGPEIHAEHGTDIQALAPLQKLIGADLVWLDRKPSQLRPNRTLRFRADPVTPAITGQKISAGIADMRKAKRTNQCADVPSKSEFVRRGVRRLIDAGIHCAPHVFNKGAV